MLIQHQPKTNIQLPITARQLYMLRVIRLATTSRNRPTPMVGYAQSKTRDVGVSFITAQFLGISQTTMPLQSIIPVGANADGANLQTLDASGRTLTSYTWAEGYADDGTDRWDLTGWVDESGYLINGVAFENGAGLAIFGNGSDVQTAGKVGGEDVAIITRSAGVTCIGNPFPVSVDLQDLLMTGANADGANLQTLDASGRTLTSYTWAEGYADDGTDCWNLTGWADDSGYLVTGVTFAPGEGIVVFGNGATIIFPAPAL